MKTTKILILGLCSLSFMGSVSQSITSDYKRSEVTPTPIQENQEHKKDSLISEFQHDAKETLEALETFAKKQAYKKRLEEVEKQKIRDYMRKVEQELSKSKIRVLAKQDDHNQSNQQVDFPILAVETDYGKLERDSLCVRHKFLSSKCKEWKYFYSLKPISSE